MLMLRYVVNDVAVARIGVQEEHSVILEKNKYKTLRSMHCQQYKKWHLHVVLPDYVCHIGE